MKTTYDKDIDAAYIYLKFPIENGEIKKTTGVTENIMMDYNEKGTLLGIEVLSASKILPKKVIEEAIKLTTGQLNP